MALSISIFLIFLRLSSSSNDGDERKTHHALPSVRSKSSNKRAHPKQSNARDSFMCPFVFPQLYRCKKDAAGNSYEYRSQSREDVWLWNNIFMNMPLNETLGGTFLEIGGLDGIKYSNTFFFERKLDWRGILIEGHPSNDIRVSQPQRPNSAIFTVAVCPTTRNLPGNLTFTAGGGATGAAVVHSSESFLRDWHKDDGQGLVVSCIPIQSIIESTGLLDIDLFSLDVEGAELAVLETLDFSNTNIRVLVVELDQSNMAKDEGVRQLILSEGFTSLNDTIRSACGYKEKGCTKNEVFINPDYASRKAARAPHQNYVYGTGVKCT